MSSLLAFAVVIAWTPTTVAWMLPSTKPVRFGTPPTTTTPRQHYFRYAHDRLTSLLSGTNDDNDQEDIPFFDDFGDMLSSGQELSSFASIDPTSSESAPSNDPLANALQQRIRQVSEQEELAQYRVQQNWQHGNWQVRGVTLDLFNDVTYYEEDESLQSSSQSSTTETNDQTNMALVNSTSLTKNNDQDFDPTRFLTSDKATPFQDITSEPSKMDASSNDFRNQPIYITTCAIQQEDEDDDDDIVLWMGRTDGSLVGVSWSAVEPWARFSTQLVPRMVQNQFTVKPSLVRDETINPLASSEQEGEEEGDDQMPSSPEQSTIDEDEKFQLVAQSLEAPSNQQGPVTHILPLPQEHLVLSSTDQNGDIQAWLLPTQTETISEPDAEDASSTSSPPAFLVQAQTWSGVHTQPLVALDVVPNVAGMVCSVSQDGTLALWDASAGLTSQFQLTESNIVVTSAHIMNDYLMIGTSEGRILIFLWTQILEEMAQAPTTAADDHKHYLEPDGSLLVNNEEKAVTCIASCTSTTTSRMTGGTPQEATYIATGDETGLVKQWQVFDRPQAEGVHRVETWPKLATQRLQGKAHVFCHCVGGGSGVDTDDESIRGLYYLQEGKILLTASAETIRCWNTEVGVEWHTLEGFEDLKNIALLPKQSAFVTNGMKNTVCIHDFGQVSDEEFNGDDDDFNVDDYLSFDD